MSFPRYESYKDSGVPWLGEVPKHWIVKPLKYVASIASGGTPSKDNEEYWNGTIPWASAKDLKADVLADTTDHLTELAVTEGRATLEPSGTVLVLVRGMMLARTFPVCTTSQPMAINQDLKALRGVAGMRSEFLAWLLRGTASESLNRLDEAGHGTKALRMEAWTSLPVCVPPGPEQATISTFLDRETVKIDALIAEQERLIALLGEKREVVVTHAVTKGLDPNAPMKDSGLEWLGEVPEHWSVHRIRRLFRLVKRQDQEELMVLSVYRDFGVLDKASRLDNNNKTPDDLSLYQTVEIGDLVVNKMKAWQGSLGISLLKGITSPDYAVFQPMHSERSNFLNILLRCKLLPAIYKSISNGIRPDQWRIEPDKFLDLALALPPVDEQDEIVAHLEKKLAALDQLADEAESANALLQERRSALISAAVTGKIDVRSVAPATAEAA